MPSAQSEGEFSLQSSESDWAQFASYILYPHDRAGRDSMVSDSAGSSPVDALHRYAAAAHVADIRSMCDDQLREDHVAVQKKKEDV